MLKRAHRRFATPPRILPHPPQLENASTHGHRACPDTADGFPASGVADLLSARFSVSVPGSVRASIRRAARSRPRKSRRSQLFGIPGALASRGRIVDGGILKFTAARPGNYGYYYNKYLWIPAELLEPIRCSLPPPKSPSFDFLSPPKASHPAVLKRPARCRPGSLNPHAPGGHHLSCRFRGFGAERSHSTKGGSL
jgi:hypothetical protein